QELLRQAGKKFDDERKETAVKGALTQALEMRKKYSFKLARETLLQAQELLGGAGNPSLREQLNLALNQLTFAEELDRIRQAKSLTVEGKLYIAAARQAYAAAFKKRDRDVTKDDEAAIVQWVAQSPLRDELLAALDDWLGLEPKAELRNRLAQLTAKIT